LDCVGVFFGVHRFEIRAFRVISLSDFAPSMTYAATANACQVWLEIP
jgi:hypothetical protein